MTSPMVRVTVKFFDGYESRVEQYDMSEDELIGDMFKIENSGCEIVEVMELN